MLTMMRRGQRALFGMGGFLMVLATVSAPLALGATPSWEFDTPSYDFGAKPYQSGPSEPHEFTLTNTGETPLVAKAVGYKWSERRCLAGSWAPVPGDLI